MKLHLFNDDFDSLIQLTSDHIGIPPTAVKRDYYIVMLLQNLQNSPYVDLCVFKGGTSLSKCYQGSIDRFSEDIDLTFIPNDEMSKKQYDKMLKRIETAIIGDAQSEKIESERNDRNKSSYVWFDDSDKNSSRVKLEIGSSVKPEPYEKHSFKTYIQEYLESRDLFDEVIEFGLDEVTLNVLCIERTFIDKLFSVKRHAICNTLNAKVRHIYDVQRLFTLPQIQTFLKDKETLKNIIQATKKTDIIYLEKRNISQNYNSSEAYDFDSWKHYFNDEIKSRYERLHEDLLYTNEKQNFDDAIEAFTEINDVFNEIGE